MLETASHVNVFLVQYCWTLVMDVADMRLAEQPVALVNHPDWILGHLALTAEIALEKLGGAKVLAAEWSTLFGAGSKPSTSRSDYPPKDELLQALEQSCQRLRQQATSAAPELLARPTTNPRAKEALPTLKEMVAFVLTGHMGVHVGQLTTWRRLIGLPPMF
jgi:hypothetical protein